MYRLKATACGLLCCALSACSGTLDDAGGDSNGNSASGGSGGAGDGSVAQAGDAGAGVIAAGTGGGSNAASCDPSSVDPGPSPLQRLTPSQYRNTIADLFGTQFDSTQLFPDERARAHIGLQQADASQLDVEVYGDYARSIAAAVAASVDTVAPCASPADLTAAQSCATAFLSNYGARIFRSPLSDGDQQRLLEIFALGFQGEGYAHGVELMLSAMLQSPRFLYRPELGDATQAVDPASLAVPLSGHELASRLAFAFWNSAPDAELLAAADSGVLLTAAGRQAQVTRLIADPRARDSFRGFLYAWLGLGDLDLVVKDAETYPTWTADTASEMRSQSDAFFDEVLFGQSGSFETLFTQPLAPFAPAALGTWFQDAPPASGVLMLPALLSVHSKAHESFPIYRGLFVREQLLCQPLPPPPAAAAANPPQAMPGVSTRERFEGHSVDPACKGCHSLMDPIGFAFENYDAIGQYRTEDRGLPIDASGQLTGTDVDGPFQGIEGLADKLRQSPQAQACAARQWFRYVIQRFDQPSDSCSTQPLIDAFTASGLRFDSLRGSVVETPAFLLRRRITTEAL